MKNYVFDEEESPTAKESGDDDAESEDEGFIKGFDDDEEQKEECAECGTAISKEKKVTKEIEGEQYVFCSDACATEFEESLGSEEEF
ncbi:hypothetical protein HZC30_02030 [Candidatus Woesearchaeota archaeon]|nr:hypothetical protein [Candidatus Woesearchaeota archaeon]